jgi:hypothetical protein
VLLALGTIWTGAWLLATSPNPSAFSSLTAVAAVALLVVLTAGALRRAAAILAGRAPVPAVVAARRADRRDAVPRLCDPDAAGRPRPRAPSSHPAA